MCSLLALSINDWTPEHFVKNQSSCKLLLENSNALREIPLLNDAPLHCFRDKQLVRFRGMIQDMYNPEYYFQKYEVKNIQSGYCDVRFGMYTDSMLSSVIINIRIYEGWGRRSYIICVSTLII